MKYKTEELPEMIDKLAIAVKDVTGCDVYVKTRKTKFKDARLMFFNILREYTRLNLREMGEVLGKDHSTVLHSFKRFNELLETDFRFAETYNKVLDAFLEVDVDEIDVIAEEVKYVKTDVLNDEVQFLFEKIGKLESQVEKLNQELIDIKRFNIQPRNQETKVYNCSEGISNLTY